MKGCLVTVLFIVLMLSGPIGWIIAIALGIIILTKK
jgi:hypothetical protein